MNIKVSHKLTSCLDECSSLVRRLLFLDDLIQYGIHHSSESDIYSILERLSMICDCKYVKYLRSAKDCDLILRSHCIPVLCNDLEQFANTYHDLIDTIDITNYFKDELTHQFNGGIQRIVTNYNNDILSLNTLTSSIALLLVERYFLTMSTYKRSLESRYA